MTFSLMDRDAASRPDSAVTREAGAGSSQFTRESILDDYRVAFRSRQASLIGRREVLTGKAKFGIFGDGKEVAQLALARAFRHGDLRSGYYRDQTFMFAARHRSRSSEFFAQLYANPTSSTTRAPAGRSMNAHFAHAAARRRRQLRQTQTDALQLLRRRLADRLADAAAGRPGLRLEALSRARRSCRRSTQFSRNGDEIALGTIGNASCAEGMFWESVNAAACCRCR